MTMAGPSRALRWPARFDVVTAWSLALLFAAAMATQLDDASLRNDEFIGLITAQRPFVDSLLQQEDYSAPLYNLVLRLLVTEPYPPEWVVRLPALVASSLCLPAIWWLTRRLFGRVDALLATIMLAICPPFVLFAIEGRSYSLFMLMSILSIGLFDRVMRGGDGDGDGGGGGSGRTRLLYVLATTALLYSHYYASLCVAAQGAFVLIDGLVVRRRAAQIARSIMLIALPVILALPAYWLMLRFIQAGAPATIGWIEPQTLGSAVGEIGKLVGISRLGALLLVPIIASVWPWRTAFDGQKQAWLDTDRAGRWRRRAPAVLMMLWVLGSFGGLMLLSIVYRPMYTIRYGIPVLVPVLVLGVAFLRRISVTVLAASLLLIGAVLLHGTMLNLGAPPGMRDAVAWIRAELARDPAAQLLVVDWEHCEGFINPNLLGMRYYGLRDEPIGMVRTSPPPHEAILNPAVFDDHRRLIILGFARRQLMMDHLNQLDRPHAIRAFDRLRIFDLPAIEARGSGLHSRKVSDRFSVGVPAGVME